MPDSHDKNVIYHLCIEKRNRIYNFSTPRPLFICHNYQYFFCGHDSSIFSINLMFEFYYENQAAIINRRIPLDNRNKLSLFHTTNLFLKLYIIWYNNKNTYHVIFNFVLFLKINFVYILTLSRNAAHGYVPSCILLNITL